jgi:hypothetical protein
MVLLLTYTMIADIAQLPLPDPRRSAALLRAVSSSARDAAYDDLPNLLASSCDDEGMADMPDLVASSSDDDGMMPLATSTRDYDDDDNEALPPKPSTFRHRATSATSATPAILPEALSLQK